MPAPRLLLDQGLPRSCATLLRAQAGWDVVHAAEIDLSRATDARILEHARTEGRVCVTLDADFHALLALSGAAGPSVLRLRIEGLYGARGLPRCSCDSGRGTRASLRAARWSASPSAACACGACRSAPTRMQPKTKPETYP